MNIKALIKVVEELPANCRGLRPMIDKWSVLELIKLLDEPQPVKVPQFVAEKIEYLKKLVTGICFKRWIICLEKKEIRECLEYKNNQETFARAWLDGYEVEEEKRYLVKIKATKHYFVKDGNGKIFFSLAFKGCFTQKQLEEAGFGWVFDCEGVEVEEIEG